MVNNPFINNRTRNRNHRRRNIFLQTFREREKKKRKSKYLWLQKENYLQQSWFNPTPLMRLHPPNSTFDLYHDLREREGERHRERERELHLRITNFVSLWGWKVVDSDAILFVSCRTESCQSPASSSNSSQLKSITACGSCYWSVLNFFGPTGLLRTGK